MLAIERRVLILKKLQEENKVVVTELSEDFECSEETIRRDLDKLTLEGKIIKTYGGAVLKEDSFVDLPYMIRKNTNVEAKQIIADLVAGAISDGDHIMMDASSTAVFISKRLKSKKNLTIITNSVEILLQTLDNASWKVLSTGGTLKEKSLALIGYQAQKMLSSYFVDFSIISCKGFDLKKGVTDSTEEFAEVKKGMINSSSKTIVAVDSSKFDMVSFTKVAEFKEIDIVVTDKKPDEKWLEYFNQAGIECLYPK